MGENKKYFDLKEEVAGKIILAKKYDLFMGAFYLKITRFFFEKIGKKWVMFFLLASHKERIQNGTFFMRWVVTDIAYTFLDEKPSKFAVFDPYRDILYFTDKPKEKPISEDAIIYPITKPLDSIAMLAAEALKKYILQNPVP